MADFTDPGVHGYAIEKEGCGQDGNEEQMACLHTSRIVNRYPNQESTNRTVLGRNEPVHYHMKMAK